MQGARGRFLRLPEKFRYVGPSTPAFSIGPFNKPQPLSPSAWGIGRQRGNFEAQPFVRLAVSEKFRIGYALWAALSANKLDEKIPDIAQLRHDGVSDIILAVDSLFGTSRAAFGSTPDFRCHGGPRRRTLAPRRYSVHSKTDALAVRTYHY
jgi:hypothetical protein